MDKIKIIALYLPQFHTIPENDEWWGKGFTEWTNVKKAKPLFKGHNQPRVPLNDNYYNLLDDNTFKWQIDLAKKYGIDGFCFYHYWFNGKLLLEKPLENYLANKELDFPFFFSWANEPWTRSWDGKNKNILVKQVYGGERDIINHFNYMLPFFKDSRYIKKDNKPVFVLYRANSIAYLEDMIKTWNCLAKQNGFDGVFFIESLTGFQKEKMSTNTDACFYFEPTWVHKHCSDNIPFRVVQKIKRTFLYKKCDVKSYKNSMDKILKNENLGEMRYASFFVGWDNSPRRKQEATIYTNTSGRMFEQYFTKQINKMRQTNCSIMFINAWNEWAEGTYLEPDMKNKHTYLEIIKKLKDSL